MEKVKVILRMRPMNKDEKKAKCKKAWKLDYKIDQISAREENHYNSTFVYDGIISPATSNAKAYNQYCKDILVRSLDGVDTTFFVYGQTGAGKTHTILGRNPKSNEFTGIIFNGLVDLFEFAKKEKDCKTKITCSYLEIYNELVFDLLSPKESFGDTLTIYQDTANNKFIVKDKIQLNLRSVEEGMKIILKGEKNRTYGETCFNHKSSRSHTIFQVYIHTEKIINGETAFIKESTVNFVDLAGNERLMSSDKESQRNKSTSPIPSKNQKVSLGNPNQQNQRINESKHINKSLFYLTQVIKAVSKKANPSHIPFRNSPLTKILRSSFGGHSRTLLVLCIAPAQKDFEISLSTLRFGTCAKMIVNEVKTNIKADYNKKAFDAIINSYESKITDYNERLKNLEKAHRQNMNFWKTLQKFKAALAQKILNFNTPEDRYKYLEQKKKELSQDLLMYNPGIAFCKVEQKKDIQQDCHICKLRNYYTQQNKEKRIKNEDDKKLLKMIEKILDENEAKIKQNLISSTEGNKETFNDLKSIFEICYEYIVKLLREINEARTSLLPFKNETFMKSLNQKQLEKKEQEMRELWEKYYRLKIQREVEKENSIKSNRPKFSADNLIEKEEKEFSDFRKQVNQSLKDFMTKLKQNSQERLKNFAMMKNMKEQIYKQFKVKVTEAEELKIEIAMLKNQINQEKMINEKRINFMNLEKLKKRKEEAQNQNQLLQKNLSCANINQRKGNQIDRDIQENKNILFYYNSLNRKFQMMNQISSKINDLYDHGQDLQKLTGKKKSKNQLKDDKSQKIEKSKSKVRVPKSSRSIVKKKSFNEQIQSTRDVPRMSLRPQEINESMVSQDSQNMKNGYVSQRTMPLLSNTQKAKFSKKKSKKLKNK